MKIQPQYLSLSYKEFLQRNKSLIGLKIGKYVVLKKLGEGAFGAVFKGMNDMTKELIAIKVLDLEAVQRQENAYVKQIKRRLIKTEAQMMTKCQNDYLLQCFDIFENQSLKLMLIEFCSGGTLDEQIHKNGFIPEDDSIKILKQVLNGLAEMHRNGIIHRDLKAQNILSHQGVYKIGDFGFSKQLKSNDHINQFKHTKLGTVSFMAPEVLQGKKYGLQADIWSMGVIFYHMLFGKLPYKGTSYKQVFQQIKKNNLFQNKTGNTISEDAKDFIRECLIMDSQKRLNWKNITKHSLFKKISGRDSIDTTIRADVALDVSKMNLLDTQKQYTSQKMINHQTGKNSTNVVQQLITLINPEELNKKNAEVKPTFRNYAYSWSKAAHFQCLKTELILKDIIEPLQLCSQEFLASRQTIQILYLLSVRCFNNISFKNFQSKYQKEQIVTDLLRLIDNLYKKAQEKFSTNSKKLTSKQSEVVEVVKDKILGLIQKSSMHEKDLYLTGLQSQQKVTSDLQSYTKSEQIYFTHKFLEKNFQKIANQKKLPTRTLNYIQNYDTICKITLDDVRDEYFKTYVARHFNKE